MTSGATWPLGMVGTSPAPSTASSSANFSTMTVAVHSRAYRVLQNAPSFNPKPTDKRLKRSHGRSLHESRDRSCSKDCNPCSKRSTSPLSVVDFHEELNFSPDSCPSFVDKTQPSASPTVCGKSKTKKPARRVQFDRRLVTQVVTRPRTLPQDVHRLFYSSTEMSMFRRNYYAYLNSKNNKEECYVDDEDMSMGDGDCKFETILDQNDLSDEHSEPQKRMLKRQLVVKAVVSHQGETREYYHEESQSSLCKFDVPVDQCNFDNSDFWNGTITWF